MRSWGLVFKPRGGIAGTGFGAAVVANVVSACAPIRPVLLPGWKPASTLLAAQALPLCRRRNAAFGPEGAKSAAPLPL